MLIKDILREDEEITFNQLKMISQYAAKLFKSAGLDIVFTKHFLDRANDPRNIKPIKALELAAVFNKAYKQLDHGKKIARLGPEAEAVLKDMEKDINMPFVLKWDTRNQELDVIFKTVMRKRNFMTSNPTLKVENKYSMKIKDILLEGGNVFKSKTGESLTKRINQADVPTTIKWLEKITGLDLTGNKKDKAGISMQWLGSTGRKDTSGDLDLVVLTKHATKEQLASKLAAWLKANKIPDADIFNKGKDKKDGWIDVKADVHFRTPINGNPKNGFVQTDFNFFDTEDMRDYATFYFAGTSPNFKGMYRNIFMSSLAKLSGHKISMNGLFDSATNKLVKNGLDPDYIAKVILQNKSATRENLATVENILQALKNDPNRKTKITNFAEVAKKEGLPFDQVLKSIWGKETIKK